jgi:hypothetical protein
MRFIRIAFIPVLLIVLIGFSSCEPDPTPEPSIEEAQLKLLTSKTWTIDKAKSAKVEFGSGTPRTDEYEGMTLTISGTFSEGGTYNYTVSNRPSLSAWPASGTWTFDANDPENLIIRTEDNIPMTYSVTESQLQLVFNYAGAGYARTSAVEGSWIFLFK